MADYRFRLEGALLVLQVGAYKPPGMYDRGSNGTTEWRDAKVEDIPLANVFDTSPRLVAQAEGYVRDDARIDYSGLRP